MSVYGDLLTAQVSPPTPQRKSVNETATDVSTAHASKGFCNTNRPFT